MRILIFYDLPMIEKVQVKEYNEFYRHIKKLGFYQVQYSIYCKVVLNEQNAKQIINKLQINIPSNGNIRILKVTEKQYESMLLLKGSKNDYETRISNNKVIFFGELDETD